MPLSGKQFKKLSSALNDAFPTYQFMQVFLKQEMDLDLANIANPDAMPFVIFEVLQFTDATNRTTELVEAARRNRPGNEDLLAIADDLQLTPVTPPAENLEKLLNEENIQFDVAIFRKTVADIESRVCRIDLGTAPAGTGFLIGPSAVMTNYHVVKNVIDGKSPSSDLKLRFDYKLLEDGTTINSGTVVDLASDWLIDSSPYSEVDTKPEPKPGMPQLDELDYAVLRTASEVGDEDMGKVALPGFDSPRGFVKLPSVDDVHDFESNKVLFIMQHPLGSPMKLTANIFRSMNGNDTRVTYLNDTEPGSSGSACFSANWELVALHHSGDPEFKPEYNEGIPMHAIVKLLQERDKLKAILPQA